MNSWPIVLILDVAAVVGWMFSWKIANNSNTVAKKIIFIFDTCDPNYRNFFLIFKVKNSNFQPLFLYLQTFCLFEKQWALFFFEFDPLATSKFFCFLVKPSRNLTPALSDFGIPSAFPSTVYSTTSNRNWNLKSGKRKIPGIWKKNYFIF